MTTSSASSLGRPSTRQKPAVKAEIAKANNNKTVQFYIQVSIHSLRQEWCTNRNAQVTNHEETQMVQSVELAIANHGSYSCWAILLVDMLPAKCSHVGLHFRN